MGNIWRERGTVTKDRKIYRLAYWCCCAVLAVTFLSGYHKILYPDRFALAVYRFHLLPDALVNISALFVPWLEMVCAACLLLFPKFRIAALWITLFLLAAFTTAIGINLIQGTAFSCGCFSNAPDAEPMNGMSIVRNFMLMALTGLAFAAEKRSRPSAGNMMV
ncbi:hypothetical protein EGM51_14975 [Verrucomicrobia bacterium S94]|nr:hypothetical protein EGM51_14975 [Verrucomicrobia bacterium S94]